MSNISELNRCIANILITLRKKKSFSQERLAEQAELDRTYISLLERGLRQPTIKTLFALAKALSIPPHQMLLSIEKCVLEKTKKTKK